MMDLRVERMAQVLVAYSTSIEPGDRVVIEAEPAGEPLVRALFEQIIKAGGHPHLLMTLSGRTTWTAFDEIFMAHATDEQLDFAPTFHKLAYDTFEARIRIHSRSNTKDLTNVDHSRLARRSKALDSITRTQFERGATGEFKWVTTLFPTNAYAQDTEMSLDEFEDLVFRACHVDDPNKDASAYWKKVDQDQKGIVEAFAGGENLEVRGVNCDLTMSIKGRKFLNSSGKHNMPDGEVFTGPVEDSVNGWVRFTYPMAYRGSEVDGVELKFEKGKVVEAMASKNQAFLDKMLETDSGARFLGEFAIGNNYGIQHPTRNILFDEKLGGSIHMALGAGYPETGSVNKSAIHWDLICDMQNDSEILVDGEQVYKDGKFTI